MMGLSYIDYETKYQGKVDEEDFGRLKMKAISLIDYYTFGRASKSTLFKTNVDMATVELIDLLVTVDEHGGREIVSEAVSTWSRTYAPISRSVEQRQKEIITRHLAHTGLMYRGV